MEGKNLTNLRAVCLHGIEGSAFLIERLVASYFFGLISESCALIHFFGDHAAYGWMRGSNEKRRNL